MFLSVMSSLGKSRKYIIWRFCKKKLLNKTILSNNEELLY